MLLRREPLLPPCKLGAFTFRVDDCGDDAVRIRLPFDGMALSARIGEFLDEIDLLREANGKEIECRIERQRIRWLDRPANFAEHAIRLGKSNRFEIPQGKIAAFGALDHAGSVDRGLKNVKVNKLGMASGPIDRILSDDESLFMKRKFFAGTYPD